MVGGEYVLSNGNGKSEELVRVTQMAQALWDLNKVQNAVRAGLEVALGEVDFTADQFRVLSCISKLGAPTMGEMSSEVSMPNATLSRIVDSLEDRALAYRLPHPEDRRRISVNLSDMGLEKLNEVLDVLSAWESAAQNLISEVLADELRSVVKKSEI